MDLLTDRRSTVMHIVTSDKMHGIENMTDINEGMSKSNSYASTELSVNNEPSSLA